VSEGESSPPTPEEVSAAIETAVTGELDDNETASDAQWSNALRLMTKGRIMLRARERFGVTKPVEITRGQMFQIIKELGP
jgi:hypothetical protein